MTDKLRELSKSPHSALELGKAAEHLVVADLILGGYRAFLTDQGLPYDVVVDLQGRLVRIQVKACCFSKNINAKGRNPRIAYSWSVRQRGKGGYGPRLSNSMCDLVALVALDIKAIAYLPIELCGITLQLIAPGDVLKTKFTKGSQWARTIAEFPFSEAISGDHSNYKAGLRKLTHCAHGHEYTPNNTYLMKGGYKVCRECSRLRYQARPKVAL